MLATKLRSPYRLLISVLLSMTASVGSAAALETDWVTGHQSRARLLAGRIGTGQDTHLLAFVEIELGPGWKTYWRTPGDAGGLPPSFHWEASSNLAAAQVLYPVPKRMTDRSGDTLGYKDHVIFPVEIQPQDAAKALSLNLSLQYGICKDICVPIEAALTLEVPPGFGEAASETAREAWEHVPRPLEHALPSDPVLIKASASDLDGKAPRIVLEVKPGAGSSEGAATDVFLEAPEGLYVPLPVRTKDGQGGIATFESDLTLGADVGQLKGKTITATLVGPDGASIATFPLQ